MYASLGFDSLTAPQAAVFFALLLGLLFGALAERTGFCLRRALVGADRRAAGGVWLTALAVALLGTQSAIAAGWIAFDTHRLHAPDLPVLAIVIGGLLFGAGMVLTRGCVSRLTVLSATGNLRALMVLLVFAVTAHATMKGVLVPLRSVLSGPTLPLGEMSSLAALPGGAAAWTALLAIAALAVAARSGARPITLLGAALLGALVPLGWVGTGWILYDDFDPIALQSLSFTLPWSDTLFWTLASSAIPAGFGVGLIGGVLAGSFLSAAAGGRLAWQSFTAPRETGRYMAGAVLMGTGGVLAGGCTVGAGLSGVASLSLAALLALIAMAAGALALQAVLGRRTTAALQPAE
ncbi:YeeE/YedE family protein [Pseudoponticoccus marisrubri]|uniref:YeeE/YedE family protein n=1 Tax=Pseudoponticoccus marisrubri TaxID=1685382 RepID=A0A0W7WLQ1_9RHOB|nr:YeeE/YedE family protein [Pseudoponticoccus marisrubri]KUF11506.1 YeeE/YedE family protein [Pseudoponticoccus marisrubri]